MVKYNEITKHYRLGRQHYPPPHSSLNKQQATAWRQLQTNTFPNPIAFSHYYPDIYSDRCKHCNQRADLKHIIWACPTIAKGPNNTIMNAEQWETALLSSNIEDQLQVIRQAEDAARAQGLLAAI
uniref:Metabotropic glutamate receptor 1 n=1 Tax=Rhipicephalus appendiculatus TaxID=34631 RepID=A0A131Z696_RHIAP